MQKRDAWCYTTPWPIILDAQSRDWQFNRKYEDRVLKKAVDELKQAFGLETLRAYLLKLTSYHYREQQYHPKTELGGWLVQQATEMDLPFSVVLFDSWFLRRPLIDAIEQAGKDWIGACPKDRNVLFKNRSHIPHLF